MSGQSEIPARVQKVLQTHGLEALTFAAGSTPTADMAAAQIGCAVGQIAKSLLFKGKDGHYGLFVCPGDQRVDSKKIKQALGAKARMATPEETLEITGYRPGSVCPFDLDQLRLFIDRGLAAYTTIYPAAGTDASGVPVSFDQLKSITGADECQVMVDSAASG